MMKKFLLIATLIVLQTKSSFCQTTWPPSNSYVYWGAADLDHNNVGNYALLQERYNGITFLNSPSSINLRIGNSDKMHIANNGNIGIGTTNPSVRLNVVGQGLFSRDNANECCSSGAFTLGIAENTLSTGKKASISFHNAAFDEGVIELSRDRGYRAIKFYDHQSHGLGIDVNGNAVITGNVGIGNSGNGAKLTINQSGTDPGSYDDGKTLFVSGNFASGQYSDGGIEFRHDNLSQGIGFGYNTIYQTGYNTNNELNLRAFGNGNLTLNAVGGANGNVGIGTTTPDSKLTVAGKIHSQEVKVTVNAGADFVFKKDYTLRPLKEVEAFISKNQHLPEIASADEMKTTGIELGEMNIKLLQKIEELTLYVIQLNKEIEKLKSEKN